MAGVGNFDAFYGGAPVDPRVANAAAPGINPWERGSAADPYRGGFGDYTQGLASGGVPGDAFGPVRQEIAMNRYLDESIAGSSAGDHGVAGAPAAPGVVNPAVMGGVAAYPAMLQAAYDNIGIAGGVDANLPGTRGSKPKITKSKSRVKKNKGTPKAKTKSRGNSEQKAINNASGGAQYTMDELLSMF